MGEAESREEELKPMPTNLTISVTPDEDNGTTQTDLFCNVNHCGKLVTVVSNGPKTVQQVVCPEHGLLTSFPDQATFREFLRVTANKILAMKGHPLIESGTPAISGDELKPPESTN